MLTLSKVLFLVIGCLQTYLFQITDYRERKIRATELFMSPEFLKILILKFTYKHTKSIVLKVFSSIYIYNISQVAVRQAVLMYHCINAVCEVHIMSRWNIVLLCLKYMYSLLTKFNI